MFKVVHRALFLCAIASLVFLTACPPPPPPAPSISISSATPTEGSTCISTSTTITFQFSAAAATQSISGSIDPPVGLNENWAGDSRSLTLTPTAALQANTQYTVTVTAVGGVNLAQPFVLRFTTEPSGGCGTPSGTTFYVSTTGNDSNPGTMAQPWRTITKAANTLEAGQTVIVRGGTYNEQVLPQNSGTENNVITYMAAQGETVTIDGTNVPLGGNGSLTGLVGLNRKSYIRISGFNVFNAGTDPVNEAFDAGILAFQSDHITIDNNHTRNTVSSGIGVWGGNNIVVEHNEVELAVSRGSEECMTLSGVQWFWVRHNLVHTNGPMPRGGEGIDAKDGCKNGYIHNNEVRNLTFSLGIYIEAGVQGLVSSDIWVWNNLVHDITMRDGIVLASERGALLERISVFNNIVYNTACNGIVVSDNNDGEPSAHPIRDVLIINNTVFNCGGSCPAAGGGTDPDNGGIAVRNMEASNITIRNNIASQNSGFQVGSTSTNNIVVQNNLLNPVRNHQFELIGTGAVQQDPMFVNSGAADFHLQSTSPAIGAGLTDLAPMTDFENKQRGTVIDIGALEFQAGR